MLSTIRFRLARMNARFLMALAALCTVTVVVLPLSTAQACGITRQIHNRTGQNLYVEIWMGIGREWVGTDPIKPGATLDLEYLREGQTLLITGPRPMEGWGDNALGIVLDVHRCDLLRMRSESKLKGYEVTVSVPKNAEITISRKR
jgi:hypothetical protein